MLPGLSSFALRHQRQTGQLLFCVQRYGILMEKQPLRHIIYKWTDAFTYSNKNGNLVRLFDNECKKVSSCG